VAIVLPTASLCGSGTAIADINQPILPGANVTSKDLPNGPKPLDALKGVGLGGVGDKVSRLYGWSMHPQQSFPGCLTQWVLLLNK